MAYNNIYNSRTIQFYIYHRKFQKKDDAIARKFQKQYRGARDAMINNMVSTFHTMVSDDPKAPLNFREVFTSGLFGLSVAQVSLHPVLVVLGNGDTWVNRFRR